MCELGAMPSQTMQPDGPFKLLEINFSSFSDTYCESCKFLESYHLNHKRCRMCCSYLVTFVFQGKAPTPRAAQAAAKLGNTAYIFGGRYMVSNN